MRSYYFNLVLISVVLLGGLYLTTQSWKLSDYSKQISDLRNRLLNTETKLTDAEMRTYALGENLWNKKHTYDVKFIVGNDGALSEFYAHKHILIANSPYFEIYFSHNTTNEIQYCDINKESFNSVMEMLYFGKFKTNTKLSSLPVIMKYLDNYMILNKYANQTESMFANAFGDVRYSDEYNNVDLVSNLYDIALKYNFHNLQTNILNNIYSNWKHQGLFTQNHLVTHPNLFYDYIRFLNCDKSHSFI